MEGKHEKSSTARIGRVRGILRGGRVADAKDNWEKSCAKCHGPDGKGDTKMGKKLNIKDLTDAKVQAGFKDAEAIKAIKEGLNDQDGNTLMKPVEGLSDDDVKALVTYVRAFKK